MSLTAEPRPHTLRDAFWRLAEAATSPHVPADYLDLFSPLRPGAELRGRIVAVQRETDDAATMVIKPGADWRGHVPGQYLRVGVEVDGVRLWRAYSLTSERHRRDRCVTITVKAIPDGVVSNYLVHEARPGLLVHLDQAAGEFTLPAQVPDKLLFLVAGSGVTPVMGMLRNLSADAPTDITIVHLAQTESAEIFKDELRSIAAAGRITLIERYDDQHGILEVATLADLVPDLAERTTYACGPAGLLTAVESYFEGLELSDRLYVERFRPTVLTPGEGGTLSFTRSGITTEADGTGTILDAAEEAGVLMTSGCRMGICFKCVLPLTEGAVRDLRNGALTTAAPGDGVAFQPCVSAAAADCVIDH